MLDKIKALLQEVENMKAANAEELEALRIKYLSKKGEISSESSIQETAQLWEQMKKHRRHGGMVNGKI